MKKIFALGTMMVLLLSSCDMYKDVVVEQVVDVKILSFNQDGAEFEIELLVDNPNGYKISLTQSHINLSFEGKPLGEVQLKEKIVIPKKSHSTIILKCDATFDNFQELMGSMLTLLFKSEYLLEGQGHMRGRALMVSKKVPLTFKEKISKRDMGF